MLYLPLLHFSIEVIIVTCVIEVSIQKNHITVKSTVRCVSKKNAKEQKTFTVQTVIDILKVVNVYIIIR